MGILKLVGEVVDYDVNKLNKKEDSILALEIASVYSRNENTAVYINDKKKIEINNWYKDIEFFFPNIKEGKKR